MLRCISMRLFLRYTASPHRERSIGRLESLQRGDQPSPFPPPCREWITWSVSSLSSSSSLELGCGDGGAPRTEAGGCTSKQHIAACLNYKSCLKILNGASESCLGAPSWPNVWVQIKNSDIWVNSDNLSRLRPMVHVRTKVGRVHRQTKALHLVCQNFSLWRGRLFLVTSLRL